MKLANQCVIFVIDDEVNHLNLLQMRLLALNFKVEVAANGLLALQKMRANPTAIDLIVTDIMMPGLDGIGLLQTLRNDPKLKNIPLIAMTGFPEKNLIDQSLKYGVTDILLKPFPFDELLSRVKSHLSIG
ncbi:MAG: response regulator transcription factor [Bdellovibrionales bacterium]|nr:response regulator transcription factor [Bdellovibrionales bacterium]